MRHEKTCGIHLKVPSLIKAMRVWWVFLLVPATCAAYIDPGTGGMIIGGGIWPLIVGAATAVLAFFIKFFYNPIKNGLARTWKRLKK